MPSERLIDIPPSAFGMRLLDFLAGQGISLSADCAGRGVCGKCRVRVVEGAFVSLASGPPCVPDANGEILACKAACPPGFAKIAVKIPEESGLTAHIQTKTGLSEAETSTASPRFGVALDIGTTTLAAALIDCDTGESLDATSCLNPQRSFGADVISRILACKSGHLAALTLLIREKTAELLERLAQRHPACPPEALAVSGNPTMLHLFCGVSPEGMGAYPFTPAFLKTRQYKGRELGLPVPKVTVLPSVSAFVGSDVVGGIQSCRMAEREGPSALIDVGTNGEMVLCAGKRQGGRLVAASTAAGPALEGANISCGVGGIPGAVDSVTVSEAAGLAYTTIGGLPPAGLCGSGLIDLVAALLQTGAIDETGYLEEGPFVLTPAGGPGTEVSLTQKDIREFQLAKSAICSGLSVLTEAAGFRLEDIETVFLAGGLGFYMNVENAVRVGLLPACVAGRVQAVGNTSLAGAAACLTGFRALADAEGLAARCETLDLNQNPTFSLYFAENMLFSEDN